MKERTLKKKTYLIERYLQTSSDRLRLALILLEDISYFPQAVKTKSGQEILLDLSSFDILHIPSESLRILFEVRKQIITLTCESLLEPLRQLRFLDESSNLSKSTI
jgi:hypothetical protein